MDAVEWYWSYELLSEPSGALGDAYVDQLRMGFQYEQSVRLLSSCKFDEISCISDILAGPRRTAVMGQRSPCERGELLALIRRILHVRHPVLGNGMTLRS